MKVSAIKLAKMQLLRGTTGKVLVNADHIRNLLKTPGLFKTYSLEITKFCPRGVHSIELSEVEQWNNAITKKLVKENLALTNAKKFV